MPQEQRADDRDDDELLDQLAGEVVDRSPDQRRPVIGRHDLDARRQTGFQGFELGLDRCNGGACIGARAKHDDAACDLTFAVQFGHPAPHVRPDLHRRDIGQRHGHAARGRLDRQRAEIVEIGEIAAGADDIFGLGLLDDRTPSFLVAALDRVDHRLMRDAVGDQLIGIEQDLILPDHPADRSHFAHAGYGLQLIAEEPVLQAT